MTSPVVHDEPDEKHSAHTADTLQNVPTSQTQYRTQSQHKEHFLAPPAEQRRALSSTASDDREAASRLNDDLELLRAERIVSHQEHEINRARSKRRNSTDRTEDAFNTAPKETNNTRPPPEKHAGAFAYATWNYMKKFPRFVRYFLYMLPGATLLLIPVLLGLYAAQDAPIGGTGGVYLMWFGIWLEVVWCSLWAARMVTSSMPLIFGLLAIVLGSSNHKKWKDIGRQMELHTALFIWMLAVLCSFLPIVNNHRVPIPGAGPDTDPVPFINWIDIVNKVIIALFVLATLNFVEKICIQWIASSFHQRTYSQRIEQNKSDIAHMVHLYEYSKQRPAREDSIWDETGEGIPSGARTPMRALQNNARQVWGKVGKVANKVGNDFIGRKTTFNHSKKIVHELLRSTASSHSLARLVFRSLRSGDNDTIFLDDMQAAFKSPEEAEVAFGIFDRDLNGDISMEEMEMVCNEMHLERKAIAASLKDLDSVIKKLDKVFLFIIIVIAIIVFISILSGSAAAGLASAGTSVLGLAWMLQATAQEFLQSIIFVFVKHPFDVGDRVTVYGNTGSMMRGDDYYVTEVSLLYTEFKKMEGHIVQAPNSVLNTLFILNQRRSAGLADPIELVLGFGTPPEAIEELKARMLEFCLENKRDYQPRIITEVRTLNEVQSFTMNFIFFHKSNFQNELLRLTRHNKFAAHLMLQIRELGLTGPWLVQPGGSREFPLYWTGAAPPPSYQQSPDASLPGHGHDQLVGHGSVTGGDGATPLSPGSPSIHRSGTVAPHATPTGIPAGGQQQATGTAISRHRSESRAAVAPILEENLGDFQDVFESRRDEAQPHMARLRSIRERSELTRTESEASSSAIGGVLSRQSHDSGSRRKIFGRNRSSTRSRGAEMV